MARLQLVIKNPLDGQSNRTVEFDEFTQADAKNKSYDLFLDEVKHFVDGEYTGYLYTWYSKSEEWRKVGGAPVLVGEVKDREAILTINRAVFSNR